MNERNKTLGIAGVVAGCLMLGAAGLGIGTASATPQDDVFQDLLARHGVHLPMASSWAQGVCTDLADGYSQAHEVDRISHVTVLSNRDQAQDFVSASIIAYCPAHS